MSLVKWGFIGLFLLPVAEMAAFVAVALTVGCPSKGYFLTMVLS